MCDGTVYKGVALMVCSSMFTCVGQLCWKLSSTKGMPLFVLLGFGLYGCGALLMILALRFGELSVLHPILSVGYILSIILGSVALHEPVSLMKILGILVILLGLICLSAPERKRD